MSAVVAPITQKIGFPNHARHKISSFDQNPANGGIPAIASVAIVITQNVQGMYLRKPPIFRMSCSPDMPWITDPAARNSSALKKACVIRWKIPAEYAATPHARNMYPSWEIVEYARTFLMSVCAIPITAANSAVMQPMMATTINALGARLKITLERAIMYTPAVT